MFANLNFISVWEVGGGVAKSLDHVHKSQILKTKVNWSGFEPGESVALAVISCYDKMIINSELKSIYSGFSLCLVKAKSAYLHNNKNKKCTDELSPDNCDTDHG